MYQTSNGERVLLGAERQLFKASLGMMVDQLSILDMDFGVPTFDQLQLGQKLFALYEACRALLHPDEPAPKLTAYLEATVATVYRVALEHVKQEIAHPETPDDPRYWREMALRAARELGEIEELPTSSCSDRSEWEFVLESLEGAVLWDHDFEMQVGMDVAPEEGLKMKTQLGIDDDYYTAVPFEVPDAQHNLYFDALMGLTPQGRS